MFDVDPFRNCPDLERFADDGGPAPDVCERNPIEDYRMNIPDLKDNHAHDFHIYVDGALRFRVPCGVCERAGTEEDASNTDLARRYGVELHTAIREQVRAHLQAATQLQHPGSVVAVS